MFGYKFDSSRTTNEINQEKAIRLNQVGLFYRTKKTLRRLKKQRLSSAHHPPEELSTSIKISLF